MSELCTPAPPPHQLHTYSYVHIHAYAHTHTHSYKYGGHTELLRDYSGAKISRLCLADPRGITVVHATCHIPFKDIPAKIADKVYDIAGTRGVLGMLLSLLLVRLDECLLSCSVVVGCLLARHTHTHIHTYTHKPTHEHSTAPPPSTPGYESLTTTIHSRV